MRKWLLAAAAAAIFVAPGAAMAQAPIVIKFSHVVAPNTPKGKGADKFKELAEKYTNGKVKVEVYPNSTLYNDKEELEALQLGAVQMLAPSNSKFGPIGVKEFEVFDLPYVLPDTKALRKARQILAMALEKVLNCLLGRGAQAVLASEFNCDLPDLSRKLGAAGFIDHAR